MKRRGVLCGVGGLAAVLLFLALSGAWSRPAGAQPGGGSPLTPTATANYAPPPGPSSAPVPPPPTGALTGEHLAPPGTSLADPTPPAAKHPKDESIDELLNRLDAIKAQKAQLDKAEQETVLLLKAKLDQQKKRLHKLGVCGPEPAAAPPVVTSQ